MGFVRAEEKGVEKPQCVLCGKLLAAECMLPSKLKRHLETVHASFKDKPKEFFIRNAEDLKRQKRCLVKHTGVNKNKLLASYKVAYRVARCKKPHTIAEELILPAAIEIMIGGNAGNVLSKVPLSNDTIKRYVE